MCSQKADLDLGVAATIRSTMSLQKIFLNFSEAVEAGSGLGTSEGIMPVKPKVTPYIALVSDKLPCSREYEVSGRKGCSISQQGPFRPLASAQMELLSPYTSATFCVYAPGIKRGLHTEQSSERRL